MSPYSSSELSFNSATIYKYIDEVPDFPQPCQFGVRRGRVRFKASDVQRYIEALPTRYNRRG